MDASINDVAIPVARTRRSSSQRPPMKPQAPFSDADDDVEDERVVTVVAATGATPLGPWAAMVRYLSSIPLTPEAAVLACIQAAEGPVSLRVLEGCRATSIGRLSGLLKRMLARGDICLNGRRWQLPK